MIIWVMRISFLQLLCVFFPPLLNIFCFCEVHTISVVYCAHLCMKCAIGISSFLKEISSFLILLFSSISLHWLLRKSFLSLLAILWNSAFKWVYLYFSPLPLSSLLLTAIYKVSSDNHFACGDDGIPIELFLILKYDAVKVLHSIGQQIWKMQ